YARDRGLRRVAVGRGDEDRAVVFDVYLRARLLDDGANDLAARPDDVAYAVGVDLDGDDARGVRTQVLARLRDGLLHYAEYVHAPLLRLLKSLGHNLGVDA